MLAARVLGPLWATIQDPSFNGAKLLLTQPIDVQTGEPMGNEVLAVDLVQAGKGDLVLIVYEGSSSRLVLGSEKTPAEAVIIGIIDQMEVPSSSDVAPQDAAPGPALPMSPEPVPVPA